MVSVWVVVVVTGGGVDVMVEVTVVIDGVVTVSVCVWSIVIVVAPLVEEALGEVTVVVTVVVLPVPLVVVV
jgi:hypothetical protein